MKKMIILGSCLVGGAVIYGFADYLHTDKKQLERMYNDVPVVKAAPAKQVASPAAGDTTVFVPAAPKRNAHRRKLNLGLYSRSALVQREVPLDSAEMKRH